MFVTHPSSDSSSVSVFGTLLYSPPFTPSPPNLLVSSVPYWLFIYEINFFHFWCVSSFGVCLSVTCLFQLLSCSPPLLQMTGSHACWTSSHVMCWRTLCSYCCCDRTANQRNLKREGVTSTHHFQSVVLILLHACFWLWRVPWKLLLSVFTVMNFNVTLL